MSTLNIVKHTPKRAALDLVRSILSSNSTPLSTKEIYNLAVKHESKHSTTIVPNRLAPTSKLTPSVETRGGRTTSQSPPLPPHPDHTIRSIRYLKETILPYMARHNQLEKIHTARTLSKEETQQRLATMTKAARKAKSDSLPITVDVWLWRKVKQGKPAGVVAPIVKEEPVVFGAEVGVGEDWSHLNKRRRRAREGKVARDVSWLKDLNALKHNLDSSATAVHR